MRVRVFRADTHHGVIVYVRYTADYGSHAQMRAYDTRVVVAFDLAERKRFCIAKLVARSARKSQLTINAHAKNIKGYAFAVRCAEISGNTLCIRDDCSRTLICHQHTCINPPKDLPL